MAIRTATIDDLDEIRQLFTDTIISVNSKDYNAEQISAWSSRGGDKDRWLNKINEQYFIVSYNGKEINGFASLALSGYLDFMFVHKNHQGKGVALQMLNSLECKALDLDIHEIISDVSITAKPFFLSNGFKALAQQSVSIDAVTLTNFKMRKEI